MTDAYEPASQESLMVDVANALHVMTTGELIKIAALATDPALATLTRYELATRPEMK